MNARKAAANAGEMAERCSLPQRLHIFASGDERPVMVSTSPAGSLLAFSPRLLVTKLPAGETVQLDLFGGAVAASAVMSRRRRK